MLKKNKYEPSFLCVSWAELTCVWLRKKGQDARKLPIFRVGHLQCGEINDGWFSVSFSPPFFFRSASIQLCVVYVSFGTLIGSSCFYCVEFIVIIFRCGGLFSKTISLWLVQKKKKFNKKKSSKFVLIGISILEVEINKFNIKKFNKPISKYFKIMFL